uniref:Uncharacterized protein n=1 Tax=Anguilla anguilla TaxID=7936 RepID=A0A0E9S4L4_ANGAN
MLQPPNTLRLICLKICFLCFSLFLLLFILIVIILHS